MNKITKLQPSDLTVPDETVTRYKLAEQSKLEELKALQNLPTAIASDDIQLIRLLIRDAVDADKPALAEKLSTALTKACSAYETSKIRSGELVDRSSVLAMASSIVSHVCDVFRPVMDDEIYHKCVDELCARILKQTELKC